MEDRDEILKTLRKERAESEEHYRVAAAAGSAERVAAALKLAKIAEAQKGDILITPAQLQETLRHQRISGGRLGSTLVAQGIINEDSLMDFLAKQTGVPRLDVKQLEVPAGILKRIPRRLAEQMTILPVGLKEPRSLVLAMADPLDLNAVDSARFASGMSIEPVVASHKALRQAIADNYGRLEGAVQPLAIDFNPLPAPTEQSARVLNNPFLSPPPTPIPVPVPVPVDLSNPFNFFPETKAPPPPAPAPAPPQTPSGIIPSRSAMADQVRTLESFGTRALVFGLIRMLQRRGIIGPDELQRFLEKMVQSREIDPDK